MANIENLTLFSTTSASWTAPESSGKSISPCRTQTLTCCPAYLAHVKRAVHKLTFEEHDKHAEEERRRLEAMNGTGVDGEDDLGVGDEPEDEELSLLDPKEWKKQDHYQVLGLSHLRYRQQKIRSKIARTQEKEGGACRRFERRCVLQVHLKGVRGATNPERRRQFDSVDPYYELLEADVPVEKQLKSARNPQKFFFDGFAPVFEREARFSRKQPVPMLGGYEDPKEVVSAFYDFWYNFDSWRSFEVPRQGADQRGGEGRARGRRRRTRVASQNGVDAKQKEEEEKKKAEEEAKRKEEEEKVARAESKKAKAAAANAAKKPGERR
ncbi:uncharacterized protein B0H18DRAFT_1026289, partial [Fomitopsis serialis]|uniref:uncharacterized protein n=1 Tax=Fomitopsis serialis TaxID=139415 RepID=UPI002007B0C2